MANDVTRNPWIIDTASATPLVVAGTEVRIRQIEWANVTNLGDIAKVSDGNNRTFWHRGATVAHFNEETIYVGVLGKLVNGLTVPTLGSGTLYIHFFENGG